MTRRILQVGEPDEAADAAATLLRTRGYEVVTEATSEAALARAVSEEFDAVLAELRTASIDGLDLCERMLAAKPSLPVVVVGYATLDAALGALRAGAHDLVTRPIEPERLFAAVRRAAESAKLREGVRRLRARPRDATTAGTMLGESPAMRRLHETLLRIAPTDATVVITGESGTGKELLARELHDTSERARGPFVAINCAAVPSSLLESELFGHERGAFTDAKTSRRGLFLEADGGTLFLDEIGEMPAEMQAKLLRALQQRAVRAVGGSQEVSFDARVVAATARELEQEVLEGRFRSDLFYRINVCSIRIPPLRERGEDIGILAQHFVERFARRHRKPIVGLTAAALQRLLVYPWPGNVRELENCVERAVAMTRTDLIVPADLPEAVSSFRPCVPASMLPESIGAVLTLDELQRSYLEHVLGLVGGNKSQAARLLGCNRRTIYRLRGRVARREDADPPAAGRRPVVLLLGEGAARSSSEEELRREGFDVRTASRLTAARHVAGRAAVIVVADPSALDAREVAGASPVIALGRPPPGAVCAAVIPEGAERDELIRAVRRVASARRAG